MQRYVGIDFSGGANPWKMKCKNPAVWIATVHDDEGYALTDLRPVQNLGGFGKPFERLVAFLKLGNFAAAAIDAPFALPSEHMPRGYYSQFLDQIRSLPNGTDRPFPLGAAIQALGETVAAKASKKPYRKTEKHWANLGVNTRSTMWNGIRGGSPFTAACLSLLSQVNRPVWPWHPVGEGMLVEAFPAAQLRWWGLPHQKYSGIAGRSNREKIIESMTTFLNTDIEARRLMMDSSDALDAVISCFAAIAVSTNRFEPPDHAIDDGMIAVLGMQKNSPSCNPHNSAP